MQITFLGAALPLVKSFSPTSKDAYPLVTNFTSYNEEVKDPLDLFKAIDKHATQGHCLLKGTIARPLSNEPRRGTTSTDSVTQWVCLDFDRHETADIDEELTKLGVGNISYTLQYSASHGLDENEGTVSAHVFMLLSKPMAAPTLKAWVMEKNLTVFNDGLRLSRSKNTLSWPLDITTCQNDKLLYIAPPIFKGMKDPMGKNSRISFVKRKLSAIPVETIGEKHINALKVDERAALNALRVAEGLPKRTAKTTWVTGVEVQNKPDVCTVTETKDCGEYIRLNLNGGDSWAYYHYKDNFELIHDFKSDTWYKTKELVPGYYSELCDQRSAHTSTPTEDGDLILAFRDLQSSEYYNGLWNPKEEKLSLYRAKNETQLDHWMRSHGRFLGEFIPIWQMKYLPKEHFTVDENEHVINIFQRSRFMRMEPKHNTRFPTIKGIICHMLGVTPDNDPDHLFDEWINWFACIFQRKEKPTTSWVMQGTQGTGKGYVFNKIISQLLGSMNAASMLAANVEDDFNGWMENILFAFIDEVDVDDFKEKGRVGAKLKNHITEPTIPIRHMRRTAYDAVNTCCFMFSSNMPQPVHIPEGDRRYNVGEFQNKKLPRPDDSVVNAELEAFAQFLLAHKADIVQANTIVHTEARTKIQRLGVTSLVETCQMIMDGDFEALWMARPDEKLLNESGIMNEHTTNAAAYILLLKEIARNDFDDKITRDELLIMLQYNVGNMPKTPNKFTSLLRHNNISLKRIRKNNVLGYGIQVDWKVSAELRRELEASLNLSKKRLKVVGKK